MTAAASARRSPVPESAPATYSEAVRLVVCKEAVPQVKGMGTDSARKRLGTDRTGSGRRAGPRRTGTLEPAGQSPDGTPRFRGRVRLGDGTKSDRFDVPRGLDEGQARAFVAATQAQEDANGLLLKEKVEAARVAAAQTHAPHALETCDAWFERYLPAKDCGTDTAGSAARSGRSGFRRSSARRGSAPSRDDVEDVRDKLERTALDAKAIRHATSAQCVGPC